MLIGSILLIFGLYYWISSAYGQDIDPKYYCLYSNQYPFNVLCVEQKINKMLEFAANQSTEQAIEEENEAARQWEDLKKFK